MDRKTLNAHYMGACCAYAADRKTASMASPVLCVVEMGLNGDNQIKDGTWSALDSKGNLIAQPVDLDLMEYTAQQADDAAATYNTITKPTNKIQLPNLTTQQISQSWPTQGSVVVNSSNNTLMVFIGGVWYSSALASPGKVF